MSALLPAKLGFEQHLTLNQMFSEMTVIEKNPSQPLQNIFTCLFYHDFEISTGEVAGNVQHILHFS